MEGEKGNCSTFYVPGAMSDVTIVSTPLPQAASTATKRQSEMEDEDYLTRQVREHHKELENMCQSNKQLRSYLQNFDNYGQTSESKFYSTSSGLRSAQIQQLIEMGERHTKPDSEPGLSKYKSTRDLAQKQDDRASVASSANSSLGVIPSQVLDEALRTPLVDVNHDLSLRLAQKLNLDTSLLQDGMDISALASKRYKERVAASSEDNKENERKSGRSSSDYWTIHGYSSDNSDSRNNTARRLSALSAGSGGEAGSSQKSSFSPRHSLGPLSEMNFITPLSESNSAGLKFPSGRSSVGSNSFGNYSNMSVSSGDLKAGEDAMQRQERDERQFSMASTRSLSGIYGDTSASNKSGRSSVGSNPFGNYSNASVSSADFNSGEDAMQRLERDERQFSMASTRSLSGIYGDTSASVNVDGEKLSMSSFLRSGSYPLGSLETGYGHSQPPQFGMPAKSPEKKDRPRAILPLPNDKSTFVVEEEPVRDTPWAPQSLMEQYSNIHDTDAGTTDADCSVPSLSYISEVLDQLHQGADPKEMLAQLMASKNKTKNKPDNSLKPNRISSIVEGETSFCQGIEVEPSFTAKDKSGLLHTSTEVSSCNVTDFEGGDEEACVCVMTPQSMDFDLFNELSHPVEYSFAKACYVDGQRKDSAAYVHFPVSKLMLYPGQKRTLTINIAALVGGVIKIKIDVARQNPLTKVRECSSVYGKMVAEIPRVSLLTQHKGEMIVNPDCEYDGEYLHTIVMKNEGCAMVPLKLTVAKEMADDDVEFHFGEREKQTVTVMVEPGQLFRQRVVCQTPPVFDHPTPPETIIPVKARVEFCLATTDLYQLNPVAPVTLVAPLKPYFFGAPPSLVVPATLTLHNSCDQPAVFNTVTAPGYTAHPSSFVIPPYSWFTVNVATADTKVPPRHGELTLRVPYPIMGKESVCTIQLRQHQRSSLSINNSLVTPLASRATSPTSPSSGIISPVGELKVACSLQELVWGGCPLHQRVVKTVCLKNTGRQREKLRLTIPDNSFKIVGEEDSLKSELKLSLQPMENVEIKVAVIAPVVGPQWGRLTISRISCAADKSVLPLYAFGGKPKLTLKRGVVEVEAKKYLFLDGKTLEASMFLTNGGDSDAFIRVSEASSKSSAGLTISPQQGFLLADHWGVIKVSLSVTAKRLESLLRQTTSSVHVAQLSIVWGDESTRQRLVRMTGLQGVLASRVSQVSCIRNRPIADLDKLDSSVNSAEGLWEEDTEEMTVGVFVPRTALEALRLDTSEVYVDLSMTISKPQH